MTGNQVFNIPFLPPITTQEMTNIIYVICYFISAWIASYLLLIIVKTRGRKFKKLKMPFTEIEIE